MSKHTKAEWYRLIHSGHYLFVFLLLIFVSYVALFFLGNATESLLDINLYKNICSFLETFSMLLPLLICTMTAATLGNLFHNRTSCYEIMDGSSIHKIILSKLFVYCPFVLIFTVIPLGSYFTFIGIKNGIGEMENVALFAFLFVIIVLHLVSATVMTTLIAKNLILGSCVPYVRYLVFEQVFLIMILEGASTETIDKLQKIYNWFAALQLINLGQPSYSKNFVIAVTASFVIEFIILYAAVYASYKKKRFR